MITDEQKQLAKKFQEMHKEEEMFVLPNAWNAGSAYIFEKEGFKSVATSSAGVAFGMGYPDGEKITKDDLVTCVSQITRRIKIPLSVDFESGYSEDIETIKCNARRLLEAGAVGFNLEDGRSDGTLHALDSQLKKIKALGELKKELDIDFVINARTCVYWLNIGTDDENFETATERANAFYKAGADCVFIPGLLDEMTVNNLVQTINAPLNIVLTPIFTDFSKMREIGVRRLSIGSGAVSALIRNLVDIAVDLKHDSVQKMMTHTYSYAETNDYFGECQ